MRECSCYCNMDGHLFAACFFQSNFLGLILGTEVASFFWAIGGSFVKLDVFSRIWLPCYFGKQVLREHHLHRPLCPCNQAIAFLTEERPLLTWMCAWIIHHLWIVMAAFARMSMEVPQMEFHRPTQHHCLLSVLVESHPFLRSLVLLVGTLGTCAVRFDTILSTRSDY